MKLIVSIIASLILVECAAAQETREGWSLQFRQDTFDKSVFPLAILSQNGEDFDKALMMLTCGLDAELIAGFQPERFMLFSDTAKVQFRDGDSTKEFVFSAGEVPHLGKRLILSAQETAEVIAIFKTANGSDVPFKTEKKQGIFTSIGSIETFSIMRAHCIESAGDD